MAPRIREQDHREQLEQISVSISGDRRRQFLAWKKRADLVREPWYRIVRFGAWFEPAREAWLQAAEAAGLWELSSQTGAYITPVDAHDCSLRRDPSRVLGHVMDSNGRRFHLLIEDAEPSSGLLGAGARRSSRTSKALKSKRRQRNTSR